MPQVAADEKHSIQTEACLAPSRVFRGHGATGGRGTSARGRWVPCQGAEPGRPGCCEPLPTAYRGNRQPQTSRRLRRARHNPGQTSSPPAVLPQGQAGQTPYTPEARLHSSLCMTQTCPRCHTRGAPGAFGSLPSEGRRHRAGARRHRPWTGERKPGDRLTRGPGWSQLPPHPPATGRMAPGHSQTGALGPAGRAPPSSSPRAPLCPWPQAQPTGPREL